MSSNMPRVQPARRPFLPSFRHGFSESGRCNQIPPPSTIEVRFLGLPSHPSTSFKYIWFARILGDFGLLKHMDLKHDEDREVFKESLGIGMPFRYRTPDQVAYLNNQAPLTAKATSLGTRVSPCRTLYRQEPRKEGGASQRTGRIRSLEENPRALSDDAARILMIRMLALEPSCQGTRPVSYSVLGRECSELRSDRHMP